MLLRVFHLSIGAPSSHQGSINGASLLASKAAFCHTNEQILLSSAAAFLEVAVFLFNQVFYTILAKKTFIGEFICRAISGAHEHLHLAIVLQSELLLLPLLSDISLPETHLITILRVRNLVLHFQQILVFIVIFLEMMLLEHHGVDISSQLHVVDIALEMLSVLLAYKCRPPLITSFPFLTLLLGFAVGGDCGTMW